MKGSITDQLEGLRKVGFTEREIADLVRIRFGQPYARDPEGLQMVALGLDPAKIRFVQYLIRTGKLNA